MKGIILWTILMFFLNEVYSQTPTPYTPASFDVNSTVPDDDVGIIGSVTEYVETQIWENNVFGVNISMDTAPVTSDGKGFTLQHVIKCLTDLGKYLTTPIFPGTDWCGAGDRAVSEDDLGKFEKTDRCCRAHDHCANSIETKHNKTFEEDDGNTTTLTNNTPFTVTDCSCDLEFYHCMKGVDSATSNLIGFIFFDVIKMKCIKQDLPPTCYIFLGAKMCSYQNLDESGPRTWRLYPNPLY